MTASALQAHAHAGTARRDFLHEAMFYADTGELLEGTLSFVREGRSAGEPVLVVLGAAKNELLREAVGDDDGVLFADMVKVGRNPARIIPVWHEFVAEHAGDGRPVRGIGEPIWAGRSTAELVECQRHESLLNLAFGEGTPLHLLCPYDTSALDDAVLNEARRSHPSLVERSGRRPSPSFRGLDAIAAPFDAPLPEPPASARELRFAGDTLAAARQLVSLRAAEAGLSTPRMHNLVLAANEVMTNSIAHGGGGGVLLTWTDGEMLVCDIRDAGRIDAPLIGRERPGLAQESGRGLWMANQLCELVQVRCFADGSAVRLHMRRS